MAKYRIAVESIMGAGWLATAVSGALDKEIVVTNVPRAAETWGTRAMAESKMREYKQMLGGGGFFTHWKIEEVPEDDNKAELEAISEDLAKALEAIASEVRAVKGDSILGDLEGSDPKAYAAAFGLLLMGPVFKLKDASRKAIDRVAPFVRD